MSAVLSMSRAPSQQSQYGRRDPMLEGDKLGIHTIPKGDCPQCGQAVIGPVVIALGRMWHPEHFCCAHCGDAIGHRNFFERQGKAYCETDFHGILRTLWGVILSMMQICSRHGATTAMGQSRR